MCFAERSGFGLNALLGLRLTDASLLKKCRKLLRLDLVADAIQVLAAIFRAKGEDPVLHAAQASSSDNGRLHLRKGSDLPTNRDAVCCYKDAVRRSEEHTSELQSLMRISYAVFCLKKKNTRTRCTQYTSIYRTNYKPTAIQ